MQWTKRRIVHTPAGQVLAVVDLLTAAQIQGWVAGGWGIDALLGRQTRRHRDVDLVIDDHGMSYRQLAEALTREGFQFIDSYHSPGIAIPWCYAWCHDDGHKVEVLPVPLNKPPFAPDGLGADGTRQAFAEGTIDGRPVPCLSAELQLLLHTGYPQREIDNHDVALLRAYLGRPGRTTRA